MTRHLASTVATPTTCHRCDTPILIALDEGLNVRADQTPITPAEEIVVLAAGHTTYTKTWGGQLVQRTAERIRSNWPHGTTHATHHCPASTLF